MGVAGKAENGDGLVTAEDAGSTGTKGSMGAGLKGILAPNGVPSNGPGVESNGTNGAGVGVKGTNGSKVFLGSSIKLSSGSLISKSSGAVSGIPGTAGTAASGVDGVTTGTKGTAGAKGVAGLENVNPLSPGVGVTG